MCEKGQNRHKITLVCVRGGGKNKIPVVKPNFQISMTLHHNKIVSIILHIAIFFLTFQNNERNFTINIFNYTSFDNSIDQFSCMYLSRSWKGLAVNRNRERCPSCTLPPNEECSKGIRHVKRNTASVMMLLCFIMFTYRL